MRRLSLVVCLAALAGCPSDPPPPCITVDTSCAPLYDAKSFHNVYTMTMQQSCGSTRSSCHSASGRAGGMSLEDEQTAYQQLMVNGRVKPGDPGCSKIIVRTSSPGADYQMPPGDPLEAPARCSLIQWVQQGAMP